MSEAENTRIKAVDTYFKEADTTVLSLVQKIVNQTPITLDEVKALPKGH